MSGEVHIVDERALKKSVPQTISHLIAFLFLSPYRRVGNPWLKGRPYTQWHSQKWWWIRVSVVSGKVDILGRNVPLLKRVIPIYRVEIQGVILLLLRISHKRRLAHPATTYCVRDYLTGRSLFDPHPTPHPIPPMAFETPVNAELRKNSTPCSARNMMNIKRRFMPLRRHFTFYYYYPHGCHLIHWPHSFSFPERKATRSEYNGIHLPFSIG